MKISRDIKRIYHPNSYDYLSLAIFRVAMSLNLRYYKCVSTLVLRVLTNVRE